MREGEGAETVWLVGGDEDSVGGEEVSGEGGSGGVAGCRMWSSLCSGDGWVWGRFVRIGGTRIWFL